jgi:CheY-like chemotaxis protein
MQPPLDRPLPAGLSGARILVADDEALIALDIAATLADAGVDVVGPCMTLAKALEMAEKESFSAALLDIRLGSTTTEAVADRLHARQIPFLFYSGQALPESMSRRWPESRVISKPAYSGEVLAALADLLLSNVASGRRPAVADILPVTG